MLVEYTKLLDAKFPPFSFEFIANVSVFFFGVVILAVLGYRVKGIVGSVFFMLVGAAIFLYQNGLLKF